MMSQQRTPGNYAGQPVGPNSNKTITLYAQDGQTRQTTTDQDGTISQQDYDWLKQHGGALPIDMVPQQDKALIGTGTTNVSGNQFQTLPQRTPGNYAGQPVGPNQNKPITLYAQDGQTRQTQTNSDGAISQEDYDWLKQHGGALPTNMIPQQDKALIGIGTTSNVNDQQQQQQQPPQQRTPGNYAGQPVGPNANKTITLYAQDGQTRQTTTDQDGTISQQDYDWLKQHGGALPIDMVPQQDKALIGTGTSNVSGNQFQALPQRTPGNYAGQPVGPNQNKSITLYAQDGATRQTQTNSDGAISQEDYDWLKQHGGALPTNMIPQQDKALIGVGTGSAVNSF